MKKILFSMLMFSSMALMASSEDLVNSLPVEYVQDLEESLQTEHAAKSSNVYASYHLIAENAIRVNPGEAIPFDLATGIRTEGVKALRNGVFIIEHAGDYLVTFAAKVIAASPHLHTPVTALTLNNHPVIGTHVQHGFEALLAPTVSKVIRVKNAPVALRFENLTPNQDLILHSVGNEVVAFIHIQKLND